MILSAKSSVFSDMLLSSDTLVIPDYNGLIVNTLLQFMYSGSIELAEVRRRWSWGGVFKSIRKDFKENGSVHKKESRKKGEKLKKNILK